MRLSKMIPAALCGLCAVVANAEVLEDTDVVLHNPDMGWVLQECHPIFKGTLMINPDFDYPDVNYVMLTCAWSDIEVAENNYDFTRIDHAYDYWRKRGKKMHLRLSTESWGFWNRYGRGLGVPPYIVETLSQDEIQIRDKLIGQNYILVDARNPFYRERLTTFLKALAKHFAEDGPRPVELVDLRGFGLWGEWHNGFDYGGVEERRRSLIWIINAWVEAFGDRWLVLSHSRDTSGPPELYAGPITHYDPEFTKTYKEYMAYSAFDHAWQIPSITYRRDGCGGTICSNERKLSREYYKRQNAGPMVSELCGGYGDFKKPIKWRGYMDIKGAIDDCLDMHPNYITIPGWNGTGDARAFMAERPDMVAYGLRRMGYRYVPISVGYPSDVENRTSFELSLTWVNRAVGRAIQNYDLEVIFRDTNDSVVASHPAGRLNNRLWLVDQEQETSHTIPVSLPQKGQYKLYIRMIDPRNKGFIQLPLHNKIDNSYYIGQITIQ